MAKYNYTIENDLPPVNIKTALLRLVSWCSRSGVVSMLVIQFAARCHRRPGSCAARSSRRVVLEALSQCRLELGVVCLVMAGRLLGPTRERLFVRHRSSTSIGDNVISLLTVTRALLSCCSFVATVPVGRACNGTRWLKVCYR